MATLEKLGEDIELVLRQLLFGTVRRSLRVHIIDQMKKHGFLRLDETRILERILLIEVSFNSDISLFLLSCFLLSFVLSFVRMFTYMCLWRGEDKQVYISMIS